MDETQVVAILDSDTFEVLFSGANPMRVTVRHEKQATKFPVEDGSERSDHVIDLPKEIMLDYLLSENMREIHEALKQAFMENRLVTVQTRIDSYPNMLIVSIPHDELATDSAIAVNVALEEWVSVKPEYTDAPMRKADVKDSKQASTVKRGQQTPTDAGEVKTRKASVLYGLVN